MTGLLVSVRSVDEARLAIEAGVDVLDVKEPARGALGAADQATIAEIAALAAGRVPLSVALGELVAWASDSPAVCLPEGVRYAKLGLSQCVGHRDWARRWTAWAESLPAGVAPVAVVYADAPRAASPPEEDILALAVRCRAAAVLVDTFDKQAGKLLTHWSLGRVQRFLMATRQVAMPVALAGSLTLPEIETLLPLQPWLVAVRGAACRAGRESQLDRDRLRQLVAAVHKNQRPKVMAAARMQ